MLHYSISFLFFISLQWVCYAGYIPPYIKPCHRLSADLDECIFRQIKTALPLFTKGISELGVSSLDPIKLKEIKIDGKNLNLKFMDPYLYGVSEVKMNQLKIDLKNGKAVLDFYGNFTLKAKYEIDGQILILPIKGAGDARIRSKNLHIQINAGFETFGNGGHYRLTAPEYTYKMERANFYFQNLFSGNKALAETTHNFANENWSQIMEDLAPPVVKQIVTTAIKTINKFFSAVQTDEIFPE